METNTTNTSTSFIPKKSLSDSFNSKSHDYVKKRSVIGLGSQLVIFIFVLVLFASIALFVYTSMLIRDIKEQEVALKTIHEQFDERVLGELVRSDQRLRNVATLLDGHLAPSHIFTEVEKIALQDVSLEKLQYKELSTNNTFEVGITGITTGFESVVLQMNQFEEHDSFTPPAIGHLEYTENKQVMFGMFVGVSPDLILYSK